MKGTVVQGDPPHISSVLDLTLSSGYCLGESSGFLPNSLKPVGEWISDSKLPFGVNIHKCVCVCTVHGGL